MVSRRQVKDLLRGSSGDNQTGGKHQDSSSQDGQVSTEGRRSPKLSTKGCKEEDTKRARHQGEEQSREEQGAWEESHHPRTTGEADGRRGRGLSGKGRMSGSWDAVI